MGWRCVVALAMVCACGDDLAEAETDTDATSTGAASSTTVSVDPGGDDGQSGPPAPACGGTPEVGAWEALPPMPAPLSSLAVLAGPEGPIVFGGSQVCEGIPGFGGRVFELGEHGWNEGAPMPEPPLQPRAVRLSDGTLLVVDGAMGDGAVLRRDPSGAWETPGTIPSERGTTAIGAAVDDAILVGLEGVTGTDWFRSIDQGQTWVELEGGPDLSWNYLTRSNLLALPDGRMFVSGLTGWSIFDGDMLTWNRMSVATSDRSPASAAVRFGPERLFFVMGEDCCWGPTGTIPVAPWRATLELEALDEPRISVVDRSPYPCPSRVASEPLSWRARVHGSASGRVFATLQDEAFDVFDDDDVGKLPPTPVELEESNVEAMDDGTLVAIEPCGVQGWRWQPDAR